MALPTIITRGRALYIMMTSKEPANTRPPVQTTTLLRSLALLVMAHSAFILYTLLFNAPSNIFVALNIPLTTPVALMRSKLIEYSSSSNDTLPPQMESLLTRLQSIDARGYYVRFGHDVVAQCDWCHSITDFGIFAMPRAGLEYMRTIVLVGLMTVPGSGKRAWR